MGFFLRYLTLIDFYIYELVYVIMLIDKDKMLEFPNLLSIYYHMREISQIRNYEDSEKAITDICPVEFFQKWKEASLD